MRRREREESLTVVVDTSPLIHLAKLDRLDLLAQLYREVMVPAAVWEEVAAKPGSEGARLGAFREAQRIGPLRPGEDWLMMIPVAY
jgi:hypothetical protein